MHVSIEMWACLRCRLKNIFDSNCMHAQTRLWLICWAHIAGREFWNVWTMSCVKPDFDLCMFCWCCTGDLDNVYCIVLMLAVSERFAVDSCFTTGTRLAADDGFPLRSSQRTFISSVVSTIYVCNYWPADDCRCGTVELWNGTVEVFSCWSIISM